MCTGFSTSLCALNSLFTYSSPNSLISLGKCFLCALNNRLYNGIGGRSASGAALKCEVPPGVVRFAKRRGEGRIRNMVSDEEVFCATIAVGSIVVT